MSKKKISVPKPRAKARKKPAITQALQLGKKLDEQLEKLPQHNVPTEAGIMSLVKPAQILRVGQILKKYIIDNNLSCDIQGKQYAYVDAWKFAGMNFGLTAQCDEPVRQAESIGKNIYLLYAKRPATGKGGKQYTEEFITYKSTTPPDAATSERLAQRYGGISKEIISEYFNYKCSCRIIRLTDGVVVSTGFATCSNLEAKKVTFDEYAINSMAQTRTIGKGFRNLLGYVMNAAGYESTPAEEMEGFTAPYTSEPAPAKEDKQVMTDEQFERTVASLKNKTLTVDVVLKYYILTEEQVKTINSL